MLCFESDPPARLVGRETSDAKTWSPVRPPLHRMEFYTLTWLVFVTKDTGAIHSIRTFSHAPGFALRLAASGVIAFLIIPHRSNDQRGEDSMTYQQTLVVNTLVDL